MIMLFKFITPPIGTMFARTKYNKLFKHFIAQVTLFPGVARQNSNVTRSQEIDVNNTLIYPKN